MSAVIQFLEALRELHLLDDKQCQAIEPQLSEFADVGGLIDDLVRRSWLTPWQRWQVAGGDAASLVLGPYILLDRLGRGGRGEVYQARHCRLKRLVALKVIRPDCLAEQGVIERFHREAEAAAALDHPNIVRVHDSGEDKGTHFLALEYIEGADLARCLNQQGSLPVASACDYAWQTALGLQHAFERGLVHRDVKPHNLMLTPQGQVKVMDFGLARLRRSDHSTGMTASGLMMGTADYVAPEQIIDAKKVDIRADIYSLGCTLYHLVTGAPAFGGKSLKEKLQKHQCEQPRPLDTVRPGVPSELAAVVARMMAKRPEERYATPAEVAAALAPFRDRTATLETASASLEAQVDAVRQVVVRTDTLADEAASLVPFDEPIQAKGRTRKLVGIAVLIALLAVGAVFQQSNRIPFLSEVAWQFSKPRTTLDPDRPASKVSPSTPLTGEMPKAAAAAQTVLDLGDGVTLELVLIPAGSFRMGSPDWDTEAQPDEKPQHRVAISRSFYCGRYPVTQEQYRAIMGTNPSYFSADGEGRQAVAGQNTDRFPVEMVSWTEAEKFCAEASKLTHRRVELPTEAEWEYACRAGTTTRYYWGSDPIAGPAGSQPPRPAATGRSQPNAWGLYDTLGKVWQWCADGPSVYTRDKCSDPRGGESRFRAMRGGSWMGIPANGRSAMRNHGVPGSRFSDTGFRVIVRPE